VAAAAAKQRQANTRVHNVKRFATSALPMSFRCHGDVIIDVSRFLASFSERSGIHNVLQLRRYGYYFVAM